MADIYDVEVDGNIYSIESDHIPLETEVRQYLEANPTVGVPPTPQVLPSASSQRTPRSFMDRMTQAVARTEQDIAKRGSSISFLRDVASTPQLAKEHPFQTGLSLLGAPREAGESIPANIGLGVQQRKPAGEIFRNVVSGLKGERPAELGDVARASGLPVISNPFVASALGSTALLGTGLVTKTGRRAATRVSEEVVGHAKGATSLATVSSRAKLAQRVGEIPEQARELLSKKFGAAIDEAAARQAADPSLLMDLQDVGTKLQPVAAHLKVGVRHAGSDLASLIAEDPSLATQVTIQDARLIKAGIQRSPEINRATEAGRALRQARDLIRAKEVETFPELADQFSAFKQGMDQYRQTAPRIGRLGVSAPVTKGLRGLTESEVTRKSLEKLSSQSGQRQGFSEVLGAARSAGMQRAAAKAFRYLAFPLVAGATGAAVLGKKLFRGSSTDTGR